MFEAAKCHGWMINNNIHRLDAVSEKTPTKSKQPELKKIKLCFNHPKPSHRIGVGIVRDQRDGRRRQGETGRVLKD